ncbi:RNA-guided endonuclease InsQ/TnpB family protein [Limnoraphis robusta]|uniref:Transposase n=1 Tax=Limnoraphis robusta CS-951 TaxID=1637645 RepID=A0A0F5YHC2_9CYAN|nr:RNA-guided endonuclease TnpB family protein [Limnoraphis robusta]KKD38153.1 transposase [Limnoraphis robusta CS-951]
MKYTYQYRLYPETQQTVTLNRWLRVCRYWYNRMLGERFDWWEQNRCPVNACLLICHLPVLKEQPNFYNQKKQLPVLKQDLVKVDWSGELIDFTEVYSSVLQDVCKRVQKSFDRFIAGDKNGKRSGKPRFKNAARYRTLNFPDADDSWLKFCTINGKWLFVKIPKIGFIKLKTHRAMPSRSILKQLSITKKADGWYCSLSLEDKSVPKFTPDNIEATWENSIGIDAVLDRDFYLATSDGEKLPSLKPLRRNQDKLTAVSQRKNKRNQGSKARRKLAKKEARVHQSIARSRKDFQYKTAYKLVHTGKKFFFCEKLDLKGLTRRNPSKVDQNGTFISNGQSSKSGLNKSWLDAAFGQFFDVLGQVAAKANATVVEVKPNYTSQLLSYRDEFVFTDRNIREYFDLELKLIVDRDVNASINIKRVGLDVFPTIKRRRGKPVIVESITKSTSKEVLSALFEYQKPTLKAQARLVGTSLFKLTTC